MKYLIMHRPKGRTIDDIQNKGLSWRLLGSGGRTFVQRTVVGGENAVRAYSETYPDTEYVAIPVADETVNAIQAAGGVEWGG